MQFKRLERLFLSLLFYIHIFFWFFPVFSDVSISDVSVAIYVSGPHRRDVLDAVSFLIEQLKANVPIWKKVTFSSFFFIYSLSFALYIHMINSIILCRSSMKIMRATTTKITHQHRIVGKKINKFLFFSSCFTLHKYKYKHKDKYSKQY
jgi:hypothetical protein